MMRMRGWKKRELGKKEEGRGEEDADRQKRDEKEQIGGG